MSDHRARLSQHPDRPADDILRVLDDQPILIRLPPRPTWSHQLIAITMADVLGRLFPNVSADVDPTMAAAPELPPGAATLAERIQNAHSHGGLGPTALDGKIERITVAIGAGQPTADLHVDGTGWTSYVGTEPSELIATTSRSPIGAMAAACRATAHIARLALAAHGGTHTPPASAYVSALTLEVSSSPLPPDPPVGWDEPGAAPRINAITAGAGSVMGAAIHALAHVPDLTGNLVVTDPQRLESHNHDRALVVDHRTAAARALKVRVAEAALARHRGLEVRGVATTLQDWFASQAPGALPLVLCAVDSMKARRDIQDCLPLDLINAACASDLIVVSRHRTTDGPCVCCLHMRDALDTEQATYKILMGATGLSKKRVISMLQNEWPLTNQDLRTIETHQGYDTHELDDWLGQPLTELHRRRLLYGRHRVTSSDGPADVAAPYVTALAGIILAAEALKYATSDVDEISLGPQGLGTAWAENPFGNPLDRLIQEEPRWPGHECLCRSARRTRILAARYGLSSTRGGRAGERRNFGGRHAIDTGCPAHSAGEAPGVPG
jgi:hypothetical protein